MVIEKKMLRKKLAAKKNILTNKNDISCSFKRSYASLLPRIQIKNQLIYISLAIAIEKQLETFLSISFKEERSKHNISKLVSKQEI